MRSINNQVLIQPKVTPWEPVAPPAPVANSYQTLQYAAPGAYLGGNTAFELIPGLRKIIGEGQKFRLVDRY